MNLLSIFAAVPSIIVAIETAEPASGTGADKSVAVLAAVMPMVPDDLAPKYIPQIKTYVSMLVSIYNARAFFKK